jgi:hypothetical protein
MRSLFSLALLGATVSFGSRLDTKQSEDGGRSAEMGSQLVCLLGLVIKGAEPSVSALCGESFFFARGTTEAQHGEAEL